MTEKLELYKCDICGNIIEVVVSGGGELVCCGEPMKLLKAGTNDIAATEKHVPVFLKTADNGLEIRIGKEPHPMSTEHFIMFIEAISPERDQVQRQYLYPDDEPKMVLEKYAGKMLAREFCNIHGLWEANCD